MRAVKNGHWIDAFGGAMSTSRLPAAALLHFKVGAASCEWPAIVQCPNDRDSRLGKILEEHGVIQVVAMENMQMHQAWRNFPHFSYGGSCGQTGKLPMMIHQTCACAMDHLVQAISNSDARNVRGIGAAPEKVPGFPSLPVDSLGKMSRYGGGGATLGSDIDLNKTLCHW